MFLASKTLVTFTLNMSDDEDSDSDFNPEEILQELENMKELLHRHVGKHKNVARLKSAAKHWFVSPELFPGCSMLEGESNKQTVQLVNTAEEKERQRRMSMPYTDIAATNDADLEDASNHVTTMQEELLHLFAIHDAKFQTECERERQTAQSTKQKMQDELIRIAGRRQARQAFEEERRRKIEEMEKLMSGEDENSMAVAETNEKLSLVHNDLKNAFRIMEEAKEEMEAEQRQTAEERKELLLQEIRRRPAKLEQVEDMEKERQHRIELYQQRITESEQEDDILVQVQENLLKLFGRLKKDSTVKKETAKVVQADRKVHMQEELLHKTLSKQVSKQEANERTRRIQECKSGCDTIDDNKRQKTMDTLIDVQKQLLDVMTHVQMTTVKEQMQHLKFMNVRINMLYEIRMRKSDHDIGSTGVVGESSSHTLTTRPGRRLSIIGEQLQNTSHPAAPRAT